MAERRTLPFADKESLRVRALFLAERIELRALEGVETLATLPLTIAVREQGCAVLFRYGVVVLFNVDPLEEVQFLETLKPLLQQPFSLPEHEETTLKISSGEKERVGGDTVWLATLSVERLQLVAEVLARSVVLDRYEKSVAAEFDLIEPLAASLRRHTFPRALSRDLLRHIGGALLSRHQMVGRVTLNEKPELLWEHPSLERFYVRLEDEYEISERHHVVEEKVAVISRTAETVLDLLHARRSLRVEWYIVILIVVEILLTLYELIALR